MEISRIDLADFFTPEEIASGILSHLGKLPIPVPIEDLARRLDITDIRTLETDGFEGGLITDRDKSRGVILVNEKSRSHRRRFSVGHELGHFLCPRHMPPKGDSFLCSSEDMRRSTETSSNPAVRMEVEANRFSALVLMPQPQFSPDIFALGEPDIANIVELSTRYDTSKDATSRRYVELSREPCAVVISKDGAVLRFYRHDDFPFLDLKLGTPLPRKSLSARDDLPRGEPTAWHKADSDLWFPAGRRRLPDIYEQVLQQADGYRLTLLQVEDVPDDEEDEDDRDLEESWTPKFPR